MEPKQLQEVNFGEYLRDEEEAYYLEEGVFHDDLFEFTAVAIIRDAALLTNGKGSTALRCARSIFSLCLLLMNVALQVFLLAQVKRFISAAAVHDIREVYSTYEEHMYPPAHTFLSVNGKVRGTPGYMLVENFQGLDDVLKEKICQFPLSQPYFLMSILFIWALTCFAELNSACKMSYKLVWSMPTIGSSADSVHVFTEELSPKGAFSDSPVSPTTEASGPLYQKSNSRHIIGLTVWIKATILLLIFAPQFSIACYLLWLGSRWLTATCNFTDLLMNAVALEFIFLVKDLFFKSIISEQNKLDIQHTSIRCGGTIAEASTFKFFRTALWLPVGVLWAWVYSHYLQRVLPDYNWDVHEVCADWVTKRFEV